MIDVLVLTDSRIPCGIGKGELKPVLMREEITVIDLLNYPEESAFTEEAQACGCHYVNPAEVFAVQLNNQFKFLTGSSLSLKSFCRVPTEYTSDRQFAFYPASSDKASGKSSGRLRCFLSARWSREMRCSRDPSAASYVNGNRSHGQSWAAC